MLDNFASTSSLPPQPLKQQKSQEKKRSLRMKTYVRRSSWWMVGRSIFCDSLLGQILVQEFECFVGQEAEIVDDYFEPAFQDHPKDQGEEKIEINLAKEEKETQPIFLSTSLSAKLEQALVDQ